MFIGNKTVSGFSLRMYQVGNLHLGIPTDIGPRILYLAHQNRPEDNLFSILPNAGRQTDEGFWHLYGGHRLWAAPEAFPRTYSLDNRPIILSEDDKGITLESEPEPLAGIDKKLIIMPHSSGGIKIIHRIQNKGLWPIQLACWALSVMQPNGTAVLPITPQPVDVDSLLPDRTLTIWPYTNLKDSRLSFHNDRLVIQQNPKLKPPLKIGTRANPPAGYYYWNGLLFKKENRILTDANYPDGNSTFEVYTSSEMLELETLGPLTLLEPEQETQSIEIWNVYETDKFIPETEKLT